MRSAGRFSQQSSLIWATFLQDVLGSHGDPDVLEYVAGSLEDGDFDYGNDGQEAYEAFAGVLVRRLIYQQYCCFYSDTNGIQAQSSLKGSKKCCRGLHGALLSRPSEHQVLQGTSAKALAVPLPGMRILIVLVLSLMSLLASQADNMYLPGS